MRHFPLTCLLALAVTSATFAQATQPAPEKAAVPVRRVVLFSSGVGFFEHHGKVTGNATTELRFRTEQINDLLKSLVVSDRDAGLVKTITYPSQEPIARTLRSFQLDISNNPDLAALLNQMRGTAVKITVTDETIEGTILGVEHKERTTKDDKVITYAVVNIITAKGIRALELDKVGTIDIQDATLQKELTAALTALAQARDKDKKPVLINFEGAGERRVSIGYVVETPVWKTSYRLILPDPTSKDNAKLQGWALIDNQTDNDWTDVTLDLVGGRPISFIENLYQPLYVPRPVMAPRVTASLTPQTYEAGVVAKAEEAKQAAADAPTPQAELHSVTRSGTTGGGAGGVGGQAGGLFKASSGEQNFVADFSQGVAAIGEANKVGENFQYTVKGVTLARQRSAMIPIITEPFEFDRVSIYNMNVLAKNPLHGVRLKNKSDKYLLTGPVAVMDNVKAKDGSTTQNYAGDASLADLPPGQDRLLSYGIDQDVIVNTDQQGSSNIMTASFAKGALTLNYRDENIQSYDLDNKSDREKNLVVEQPRLGNWSLKSPDKALETTDQLYRFQIALKPKAVTKFSVVQEFVRLEAIVVTSWDIGNFEAYAKTGNIPQKVKDVLLTAASKRRAMIDLERQIAAKTVERARNLEEQKNIRENIKTLPANTKSQQDAITDLSAKDSELKALNKEIKDLNDSLQKARADFEKFLMETTAE